MFFFFQAEDGIRDLTVTGVQTCALPILGRRRLPLAPFVGPMVPARNPTRSFVQHAAAGSAPPRATAPGAARHSKSKRSTVTPVGRGSPRNGASRLGAGERAGGKPAQQDQDRKSTRLNSSHSQISYAVFCLKKKTK